jgi:hypothetical protein
MWDGPTVTIEADQSDSSHRRQINGNIKENVNHFTAWRGDPVRLNRQCDYRIERELS